MKPFRFIDLFCGGGGSITGAINALNAAGIQYECRGFNHWDIAIRTIQKNHPECIPDFNRACAPIQSVLPDDIFRDDPKRIDVIWGSPSCTKHSRARGGVPCSNQMREQPEYLLPYLRLTRCRRMYIENVKELRDWGPILAENLRYKGHFYSAGMPDPRKKGKVFDWWIRGIKDCGYKVDIAVLNSADYGAATSRERLIIQAVRKDCGEKIIWPEPTHSRTPDFFGCRSWRSAAEIIDWSIPGESIFDRKKPLCPNTLRRIEAGIRKYWGAWAEPFLIVLRGTGDDQINSSAIPLSAPLPTITTSGKHVALITPFLTRYNGGTDRNHGVESPIPVIDCGNRYGVISPLFIPQQSAGTVKPCAGNPISTISTSGAIRVVSPVIMDMSHPGDLSDAARCRGGNDPMGVITCRNNWGVAMPFLMEYYGNSNSIPVTDPVPVIPTKDKFGLVQGRILILPDGSKYKLDITHRMLTSKELAAAMSFPKNYIFEGTDTDIKKQIGNAVPPVLAEALYRAFLAA